MPSDTSENLSRHQRLTSRLTSSGDGFAARPTDFYSAGGTVFASADEGASWDVAADYLPPIQSVTAAVVD